MSNDKDTPIEELSPEEAKLEAETIMADPSDHYWSKKDHPLHERRVNRVKNLYDRAFPSKKTSHDQAEDTGLNLALEGVTEGNIKDAQAKLEAGGEIEEPEDLTDEERAALQPLKDEWGDQYVERVRLAQGAVDIVIDRYGEELEDLIAEFGNDPRAIRVFAKIGEELKRDGLIK